MLVYSCTLKKQHQHYLLFVIIVDSGVMFVCLCLFMFYHNMYCIDKKNRANIVSMNVATRIYIERKLFE